MRHESKYDINPNHVEQLLMMFPQTNIIPMIRYSFPYNEFVSRGRIRHIRLHVSEAANFPTTYVFNGLVFNTLTAANMVTWTITLADRDGGYFCQDMPLTEFIQGIGSGHYLKTLNMKLDYENSFLMPIAPPGFNVPGNLAMIFYLDMYGKLND